MAEVIKHAAILDIALFAFLEINAEKLLKRNTAILTEVIRRCCEIKARVVEEDERESGIRRILNFGHTVGHALESLFKFKIPHGRAVAIGMVVEAKISAVLGLIDYECIERLCDLLTLYGLPSKLPQKTSLTKLFTLTLSDKKSKNGMIEYTLLRDIGEAVVGNPLLPKRAIEAFLRYEDFTSLVERYS
jgi:3-dehydroquinate synthase